MHTYALTHVADEKLLADLASLVSADRQTTAILIAHIAEIDARDLFAPAACTSMHAYCVRVLHLSEDAAFKRIRAARAARKFPVLFEAVADGRLHLTAIGLLAPHLTDANVDDLVAAATHNTKLEVEMLLARLAPRPDVPDALTPIVPRAEPPCSDRLVPEPVEKPPTETPARVTPLAPERFALQLTISETTRDKLERARALLRHANPSGDLAEVVDRALDALLAQLERKKFGATSRPRARRARQEAVTADTETADTETADTETADTDLAYVSNEVRRAVYERDGGQCTFMSESGERCCERGFLQFDHRNPVCRGGQPTVENLRLLCGPHNRYEARRVLGTAVVRAGRARKAAATKTSAAVASRHEETPAAAEVPDDVALALRGLGFRPDEVRFAVAHAPNISEDGAATTFDTRLRAALATLTRARGGRASECIAFA
jgi:hypothetical protein